MPTYEYACDHCSTRFERRQAITDEPLRRCPQCGGLVRRLVGGGGAILVRGARHSTSIPCERETTCCGRAQRCAKPPCGEGG